MSEETNEPAGSRAEDQDQSNQGRSRRRRRRRSKSNQEGGGSSQAKAPDTREPAQQASPKKSRSRRRSRSRRKSSSKAPERRQNQAPQPQRRKPKTPESKFGGREPRAALDVETEEGPREMSAFELFCVYHLGIAEDNRYRQQNLREVARRFDCSTQEIEEALERFGLDKDTLRKAGYDISLAQLDMQVAPEGVDKRELAKVLFSDFLDTTPQIATLIEAASKEVSAEEG